MNQADRLKKKWGDKPCDHPEIRRGQYDLGGATGDYVCAQCGKTFIEGEEWDRKNSN